MTATRERLEEIDRELSAFGRSPDAIEALIARATAGDRPSLEAIDAELERLGRGLGAVSKRSAAPRARSAAPAPVAAAMRSKGPPPPAAKAKSLIPKLSPAARSAAPPAEEGSAPHRMPSAPPPAHPLIEPIETPRRAPSAYPPPALEELPPEFSRPHEEVTAQTDLAPYAAAVEGLSADSLFGDVPPPSVPPPAYADPFAVTHLPDDAIDEPVRPQAAVARESTPGGTRRGPVPGTVRPPPPLSRPSKPAPAAWPSTPFDDDVHMPLADDPDLDAATFVMSSPIEEEEDALASIPRAAAVPMIADITTDVEELDVEVDDVLLDEDAPTIDASARSPSQFPAASATERPPPSPSQMPPGTPSQPPASDSQAPPGKKGFFKKLFG